MGTVPIDRYRVTCRVCGLDRVFIVGGGMGSEHALRVGRGLHADSGCRRALGRLDITPFETEAGAPPPPPETKE